jgi:hypothetical protein
LATEEPWAGNCGENWACMDNAALYVGVIRLWIGIIGWVGFSEGGYTIMANEWKAFRMRSRSFAYQELL